MGMIAVSWNVRSLRCRVGACLLEVPTFLKHWMWRTPNFTSISSFSVFSLSSYGWGVTWYCDGG